MIKSVKKRGYIAAINSHIAQREKLYLQLQYSFLPRKNSTNHYIVVINAPQNIML